MSNKLPANGLTEILTPETIRVHLLAASKEAALKELCGLLCGAGLVRDQETVMAAVLDREKAGSTGCGSGVAVPHARMQGIDRTVLALGLSKSGIDFGALDGLPVKIFFLIVGPQEAPEVYLRLLSQIAGLIKEEEFREALLSCESSTEVIDLFRTV